MRKCFFAKQKPSMQRSRVGPLKKDKEKNTFFPEIQVGPNFSIPYSEGFVLSINVINTQGKP